MKFFAMRRARRSFRQNFRFYLKKKKSLQSSVADTLEALFAEIQAALNQRHVELAQELSGKVERLLPRSRVERFRAGVVSLLVALLVAVLIRQSWFELYEIPSGSLRPTLKA